MNLFIFWDHPMTGRRQGQKRDRQRRITTAANALFAAQGYAETTMQEIADSADLAVGTLYNYFRAKPELLAAILRRETEDLLTAGERILEIPSVAPAEAVSELFDAYAESLAAHPRRLWRELTCAAFGEPDSLGAGVFESDRLLIAQVASYLDRLRERGAVAPGVDPGRLAIALYAIYFTWWNTYLVNEAMPLDDLRREIRHGVHLVLAGNLTDAGGPEGSHRDQLEEMNP
jgi:AcrR family transcriptional regulator